MFRIGLKDLWSRKRRLLATCSAVLLGVAFLAGTLVLGDTMRASFDNLFTTVNERTDAVVRGSATVGSENVAQRRPIAASVIDEVSAVDGVAAVAPVIEGTAQLSAADGSAIGGNGPPTMGTNWVADEALNSWTIAEGRAPAASGEVVIDMQSADTGNLEVGDRTVVRTPAPIDVTIVGIATFGDADSMGPVSSTMFTYDDARQYFMGGQPLISEVRVQAESGVSQTELVDRLTPALPAGVEAITGAELTDEMNKSIQDDFLGFFEVFLLVFAGIALLVATFSIYNTFSIIVAQRTRESALLRAIGATRGQVLRSTAVEAAVVGVIASIIGFGVGVLIAMGLRAMMDAVGAAVPGDLVIGTRALAVSVIVGVLVTLVASIAPAIRSARVAPIEALRDAAQDRTASSVVRAAFGSVLLVSGIGLVLVSAIFQSEGALVRTGLGALGTFVGLIVIGPVIARPLSGMIGSPIRAMKGMTGRLARRNSMRNPRRTAATSTALMIGVGIVVLFTVMGSSIKTAVTDVINEQFTGDLVVTSSGFGGAGLAPELADQLNALPEVEAAAGVGMGAVFIDGDGRNVTVVDPARIVDVYHVEVVDGSLDNLAANELAVSQAELESSGWTFGQALEVEFIDGTSETFTVGAVYEAEDFDPTGAITISREAYAPHTPQFTNNTVILALAPGVSETEGAVAVDAVASQYGAADAQTRQEFVASASGEVDVMLTIVYVLLFLAIVIALMGIANTLSLSIHERTRELGLLRAVGQTRSQLRSMVRWESVIVSIFGTSLGMALGVFLGWGLVRAVGAEEGLEGFSVPVGQLVIILVIGGLAGVVAGLRPARRAAKLDVLSAIATS